MSTASELRQGFRARREEIAAKLRAGDTTYAQIGALYGISRERVRQIAKLFGLERRPKPNAE